MEISARFASLDAIPSIGHPSPDLDDRFRHQPR